MKKSRKEIFAIALSMALLFIILAVSFYCSINPFGGNAVQIVLPGSEQQGIKPNGTANTDAELRDGAQIIEVTPQNVLSVIQTMKRPQEYSCERKSTIYYNGEGTTVSSLCYTSGEYTKTEILNDSGVPETNVVTGQQYSFIWSAGESKYYSCPNGEISADDVQSTPTYEDVLGLSEQSITAAEYVTLDGVGCVFVEYADSDTGYTEKYWISTDSGLLVAAKTEDKQGNVIYRCSAEKIKYEVNPEVFRLSDGSLAQDAEQQLIAAAG